MAGGQGLRMRPLTTNLPKPLLPVVGRPLMAHTLDLLASHGITDLVATVQFQAGQIRDYFGDGSDFGVDLATPPRPNRWARLAASRQQSRCCATSPSWSCPGTP